MNWKTIIVVSVIVAVLAVLGTYLFLHGKAAYWEGVSESLEKEFKELNLEFVDYRKSAEVEYKGLSVLYEKEKKTREEADVRISKIESEKKAVVVALNKAKKQIEEAPPNYIVIEIGKRIGEEEIKFTLAGAFNLTRTGANNTLFKFKWGESQSALYQKELGKTDDLEIKIASFTKENKGLRKEVKISKGETTRCVKTLNKSVENYESLKKVLKYTKVKEFGKGAGVVMVIVALLKVFKII